MQANRKKSYRISDYKLIKIHEHLYSKHKFSIIFLAFSIYVSVVILLGEKLTISSNYFILLPLIVIAISFGFRGGAFAGLLSLPLNLLLFSFINHREYAPRSLIIAEISGIVVGSVLGYISDFFTIMKKEIKKREDSENALKNIVREKEILLNEINHRVKNNLSLIKSLIQLQTNRLESPALSKEMKKLSHRIISISLVQELLFTQDSIDVLDFRKYLSEIIDNLLSAYNDNEIIYELIFEDKPLILESRKITSLGLIVNEIITNAEKYAFSRNIQPKLIIRLTCSEENFRLSFKDNGPGFPEQPDQSGLGLKLIKTLTSSLEGHMEIINNKGTEFLFNFPLNKNREMIE